MKRNLIYSYQFNLRYARELVCDLNEYQMTTTPSSGLENHPAFTLGHLVSGAALTAKYLGGGYFLPESWEALFKRMGPGDARLPDQDSSKYPSKSKLLQELEKQHQRVESLILDLNESDWDSPVIWRFKEYLPTLGDLILFMCITHENMHLGQLAAWRRAMGLPSALGKL